MRSTFFVSNTLLLPAALAARAWPVDDRVTLSCVAVVALVLTLAVPALDAVLVAAVPALRAPPVDAGVGVDAGVVGAGVL